MAVFNQPADFQPPPNLRTITCQEAVAAGVAGGGTGEFSFVSLIAWRFASKLPSHVLNLPHQPGRTSRRTLGTSKLKKTRRVPHEPQCHRYCPLWVIGAFPNPRRFRIVEYIAVGSEL